MMAKTSSYRIKTSLKPFVPPPPFSMAIGIYLPRLLKVTGLIPTVTVSNQLALIVKMLLIVYYCIL